MRTVPDDTPPPPLSELSSVASLITCNRKLPAGFRGLCGIDDQAAALSAVLRLVGIGDDQVARCRRMVSASKMPFRASLTRAETPIPAVLIASRMSSKVSTAERSI